MVWTTERRILGTAAAVGVGASVLTGCGFSAAKSNDAMAQGPNCPTSPSQTYTYAQVKSMTDDNVGCVTSKSGPITKSSTLAGGKCPDGAWFAKRDSGATTVYVVAKSGQTVHPILAPASDPTVARLAQQCTGV